MRTIAVIGTGIMGTGIAMNFLKKGYDVVVWNRNNNELKPLIEKGATSAGSPKEATVKADFILRSFLSNHSFCI